MRRSRQITNVDGWFAIKKSTIVNCKSAVAMGFFAILVMSTLPGGCSSLSPWAGNRRPAYEEKLSAPYDRIKVKDSIILDAVPKIQRTGNELELRFAESELISHSENVVASLGQSKDGYKTWFNIVTFHENRLNAVRKYFFFVDDKTKSFQLRPSRGLRFDCEMVLDRDIPAASDKAENSRRIAILRRVKGNLRKDIDELGDYADAPDQENKMLDICRMLINQTFEVILLKLDNSPVLATRLNQPDGVEFNHINFDKGKIQMVVVGDIVVVKIRLGAFVNRVETSQAKTTTTTQTTKRASRKPSSVYRRR